MHQSKIEILSAQVALEQKALCWHYRIRDNAHLHSADYEHEKSRWVSISYFFERGELLKVDTFWIRAGLVDWRSDETLTIGHEVRPQTSYTPSRGATTSQVPPPLLPLELKALIAEEVPRGTLANFCATAREEYLHLMPLLYESFVQDEYAFFPENQPRLESLLLTLGCTKSRRNLGPHPATLVRELILMGAKPSWFEGALHKALRCTADYALDGKSQLRTFHWSAGKNTVFRLLSERPAFENLTALSVRSSSSGFEFLQLPGLKSLACIRPAPRSEQTTMSRFLISLELLPTISLGLTVLKLDIWREPKTHARLLEKVVNSLRLPCLEVASIRVSTSIRGPMWDNIPGPDPDFNPFLEAHPTLYDVSVVLGSQPLCDDALPLLQTFAGRADDFLKVCDSARPIRDLAVTLFLWNSNDGRIIERERAVVAALTKTPNLRRLAIVNGYDAVHTKFSDSRSHENGMYMHGIDHSTICAIGRACPGITHLELHLKSAKMAVVKALANLHELRCIRAHFWITIPNGGGPATDMYEDFLDADIDNSEDEDPNAEYQARLLIRVFRHHIDSHLLPMAPKLLEVEINVIVAREQDPDSEHFDAEQIVSRDDFFIRIELRGGKRLTVWKSWNRTRRW